MKKILFLTAYSDYSSSIYRHTLQLAQLYDAEVILNHVFNHPDLKEISHEDIAKQEQKLKAFAKEHTPLLKQMVPIKFKIGTGDLVQSILKVEAAEQPDLIVMGLARGRYANRIFGRLSFQIVKKSSASVLLFPPEEVNQFPNKIIYTTYPYSANDQQAISNLLEWSKLFKASLNILCVYDGHTQIRAEQKFKELNKWLSNKYPKQTIDIQLKAGIKQNTVNEFQALKKGNLLVITNQKTGFWSQLFETSITQQLANTTLIPLLILKH